jgi:AcrR family transcriptional regulator
MGWLEGDPMNLQQQLRRQLKRETSRAIARAAQDLVSERGLGLVTVDDIAQRAGVSERTFFNYFSCKEEAVVGVPEELLIELDTTLRARPRREKPREALRAVFAEWLDQDTIIGRWGLRYELVSRYPALMPQYLTALAQIESVLAQSLSDRMALDAETDPSPRMLVAAVLAALRVGLSWWEESGRSVPLSRVLDQAFNQMTPGAPPPW